jgi:hypothetical protein
MNTLLECLLSIEMVPDGEAYHKEKKEKSEAICRIFMRRLNRLQMPENRALEAHYFGG